MGGFGGGGGYPPPPGGYPPPGMGMPPPPGPPPQKGGMSGAMIALIVVVALIVLGGGGCAMCMCIGARAAKDTTSSSRRSPPPKKPPGKSANDNWITAKRPYVKFRAPAGWSTQITSDKEWGIFKSPTHDAVFAFTTFNQPGESTARLGRATGVLGVTDVDWRNPRYGTVGRDHFSARIGDGSCNFHGPGGYIWYATVDAGSSDQILLIFTVSARAPSNRRAEAQAAIDSLQRR